MAKKTAFVRYNFVNMKEKQKLSPYIILTILYVITILPVIYLTVLLIGKADNMLVIWFGTINTIFLMRYLKEVFLSMLFGFLISSFTLCFIYLIWYLVLFSQPFFVIGFFIIFSVFLCISISRNVLIITGQRNIYLILSILVLFILTCSFNLNKTYPTRFENEHLTIIQIKIVDKQNKPKLGDSIEVRIYRKPLFG